MLILLFYLLETINKNKKGKRFCFLAAFQDFKFSFINLNYSFLALIFRFVVYHTPFPMLHIIEFIN